MLFLQNLSQYEENDILHVILKLTYDSRGTLKEVLQCALRIPLLMTFSYVCFLSIGVWKENEALHLNHLTRRLVK